MGKTILASVLLLFGATRAFAVEVGEQAPLFTAKKQDGTSFSLADRKGKGWTVLYFYPKAGTPGCTKQACAFRDAIDSIRAQNTEVYGVSADTVADQAKFHEKYKLSFDLLADPDGKVIASYGTKMPIATLSKRWTFLLDPSLKVRAIEKDVDPALDAQRVAGELKKLQGQP